MRTVTVEQVRDRLSSLLDEVSRGGAITIVKDGVPVATLTAAIDRARVEGAFSEMDRLRNEVKGPPTSTEELLQMIREGRRE